MNGPRAFAEDRFAVYAVLDPWFLIINIMMNILPVSKLDSCSCCTRRVELSASLVWSWIFMDFRSSIGLKHPTWGLSHNHLHLNRWNFLDSLIDLTVLVWWPIGGFCLPMDPQSSPWVNLYQVMVTHGQVPLERTPETSELGGPFWEIFHCHVWLPEGKSAELISSHF